MASSYRLKVSALLKARESHFFFFSIRVFFHRHWRLTGQQGKGGVHVLFHSTTSTRSRTFRHLFATVHVRWLSHIFNRNACIYQAATRICYSFVWLMEFSIISPCLGKVGIMPSKNLIKAIPIHLCRKKLPLFQVIYYRLTRKNHT